MIIERKTRYCTDSERREKERKDMYNEGNDTVPYLLST
jgi:hypothetical protein